MTTARIAYAADPGVREFIETIGRTEDIKLSPDNRRLAVVDYYANRVLLFALRIESGATPPRIQILDYSILSSSRLRSPHGVTFLGNDHLAVCSRGADVCVFRIPDGGASRERDVQPLAVIPGTGLLSAKVLSPGSVDCYEIAENRYRCLVCNNAWNAVTSHVIRLGNVFEIRNEGIVIESRLKIPDGISINGDHAWIAVSSHADGEVLIYRNTPELNRKTPPAAILRGSVCPHGVRFTADGKVLVADAASQYLHVFASDDGLWSGEREPMKSVRVTDDDTFYLGRYDDREGGLKGIDLDRANRILVSTHRREVLAFRNLAGLLAGNSVVDRLEVLELCRQRDSSVQRNKTKALGRRWTTGARIAVALGNRSRKLRRKIKAGRVRWTTGRLSLRNRCSAESLLDPSGPVVSLTTHPYRLNLVFQAIESIGNGYRKPSQIILWITDEESWRRLPVTLRRLEKRGLSIELTEELGPHTKYYPYVERTSAFDVPLVTADDDVIYPRDWLAKLMAAHESNPQVIHCFRARRMGTTERRLTPYNSWLTCVDTKPSHLNLLTGTLGAIYPPDFLKRLKTTGKVFQRCCPTADDIWLTIVALREGFKVAQLGDSPGNFPTVPNSQKKRLFDLNVLRGENQIQLIRTLSESDLAALRYQQKMELEGQR